MHGWGSPTRVPTSSIWSGAESVAVHRHAGRYLAVRDDGARREPDRSGTWLVPGLHAVSGAAAPVAGRPPVELPPLTIAAGGRSVPSDGLTAEVEALATLLVAVVMLGWRPRGVPQPPSGGRRSGEGARQPARRAGLRGDYVMSRRHPLPRTRCRLLHPAQPDKAKNRALDQLRKMGYAVTLNPWSPQGNSESSRQHRCWALLQEVWAPSGARSRRRG